MPVKSKGEISQNFVAFSEYMNFTTDQNCAMDNKIPEYHNADISWSKVENKKDVERLREQCTNMLR